MDRQDQLFVAVENNLRRHETLREGRRLAVGVQTVTVIPNAVDVPEGLEGEYADLDNLLSVIEEYPPIDEQYFKPLQAALQRVSTIRPPKRRIKISSSDSKGAILSKIETEIANLDQWQKRAAIESPNGPQRIRGLAGSGKTVERYLGRNLTVIAWLWARTVNSPNPAFADVDVPLASTFVLSTKRGKEAYVELVMEGDGYRFTVKAGTPPESAKNGTKSGSSGSPFLCLMSGVPMPFDYLRSEAKAGRMGARLMAVVVEGDRSRVYLEPTEEQKNIALSAMPKDTPETDLPKRALGFRVQGVRHDQVAGSLHSRTHHLLRSRWRSASAYPCRCCSSGNAGRLRAPARRRDRRGGVRGGCGGVSGVCNLEAR